MYHGLSLNPCFSGCWSRTRLVNLVNNEVSSVLILVLVDVGLGREAEMWADQAVCES